MSMVFSRLNLSAISTIFKERSLRDFIYGGVLIVFFLGIVILFGKSLAYLARQINSVTEDEATAQGSGVAFDFVEFSTIAGRLGVTFTPSPLTAPSTAPPPVTPQPSTETVGTPTTTPLGAESTPTPSPAVATTTTISSVDTVSVSLRVLNGSTVIGLAKLWASRFKEAGFTSVAVGNAPGKDYAGVTIQYKPAHAAGVEKIRKIVEKYGASVTAEKQVGENAQYDVTVTVGL